MSFNPDEQQPTISTPDFSISNPTPIPTSDFPTPTLTIPVKRLPQPALANLCFVVAIVAFLAISVVAEVAHWGFTLTSLSGQLTLALIAILFCLFGKFNFKETFSLRKLDWTSVLLCLLIGLAGQFAVRLPSALNGWIMEIFGPFPTEELIPNPKGTVERILFFLIVVVCAPLCEEILNRGFILAGYQRLGFGKTLFYVGLLFGIFHLYPFRFFYTFLLGIVLAYLVLVTGSLYSSIVTHLGFNLIGGFSPWILDWLNQLTGEDGRKLVETEAEINFNSVVSSIPVSLLATGLLILLLQAITRRAAARRPELELGYFGLVRNIRHDTSEVAAHSGAYYGPDQRYRYGKYGYERAKINSDLSIAQNYAWVSKPVQVTKLSIVEQLWWRLSFVLIFMLFGFTCVTEIGIRLSRFDQKNLPPPSDNVRPGIVERYQPPASRIKKSTAAGPVLLSMQKQMGGKFLTGK